MKKIFKKNQVIITALAVMIAVAGYLNFSDTDFGFGLEEASTGSSGTIVEDIESLDYDITDETALLEENAQEVSPTPGEEGETAAPTESAQDVVSDTPGEAVLTGATNFAAQAKVSREQIRSQNKEQLQEIIDNPDIAQEQKDEAIATMVSMTDIMEKEAAAELLLEAKGFSDVVVNLTGNTADVVVPMQDIPDDQRAQIEDIVKRKTEIAPENIVITPLSQAQEEE